MVVLDLMLPGRSGFQLLRDIRGRKADIAVLILTAKDSVDDRVTGLDGGADDYMVKPSRLPNSRDPLVCGGFLTRNNFPLTLRSALHPSNNDRRGALTLDGGLYVVNQEWLRCWYASVEQRVLRRFR